MLAAVLLAGALTLPAPVTLDGVGGVVPGMTPREAAAGWGVPIRLSPPRKGSTCRTARVRAGTLRGVALFERGRFGAVFFDRGAGTDGGVAIGATEGALRRAYPGRLRVEPHKYVRGARYYFLTRPRSPHWRIRFDTSRRKRVTQIGFGARAVEYVEGCS